MNKLKRVLLTFVLTFLALQLQAQMVLEYDIITPNTTIVLPLNGTVNVNVDWGDGSSQNVITSVDFPHTFATTGTKTVTITGTLTRFGNQFLSTGNERLTKVKSWDNLGLTSLSYAFYNAKILTEVPNDIPITVKDLSGMFSDATSFNQPIGNWNTANVTNMRNMFSNATSFNQPLGNWNTSNVKTMVCMFLHATSFNQPIGNWNTANVREINYMFKSASSFNSTLTD